MRVCDDLAPTDWARFARPSLCPNQLRPSPSPSLSFAGRHIQHSSAYPQDLMALARSACSVVPRPDPASWSRVALRRGECMHPHTADASRVRAVPGRLSRPPWQGVVAGEAPRSQRKGRLPGRSAAQVGFPDRARRPGAPRPRAQPSFRSQRSAHTILGQQWPLRW